MTFRIFLDKLDAYIAEIHARQARLYEEALRRARVSKLEMLRKLRERAQKAKKNAHKKRMNFTKGGGHKSGISRDMANRLMDVKYVDGKVSSVIDQLIPVINLRTGKQITSCPTVGDLITFLKNDKDIKKIKYNKSAKYLDKLEDNIMTLATTFTSMLDSFDFQDDYLLINPDIQKAINNHYDPQNTLIIPTAFNGKYIPSYLIKLPPNPVLNLEDSKKYLKNDRDIQEFIEGFTNLKESQVFISEKTKHDFKTFTETPFNKPVSKDIATSLFEKKIDSIKRYFPSWYSSQYIYQYSLTDIWKTWKPQLITTNNNPTKFGRFVQERNNDIYSHFGGFDRFFNRVDISLIDAIDKMTKLNRNKIIIDRIEVPKYTAYVAQLAQNYSTAQIKIFPYQYGAYRYNLISGGKRLNDLTDTNILNFLTNPNFPPAPSIEDTNKNKHPILKNYNILDFFEEFHIITSHQWPTSFNENDFKSMRETLGSDFNYDTLEEDTIETFNDVKDLYNYILDNKLEIDDDVRENIENELADTEEETDTDDNTDEDTDDDTDNDTDEDTDTENEPKGKVSDDDDNIIENEPAKYYGGDNN